MTHALEAALGRAERGVLLYGITPPRRATPPERVGEIAQRTLGRLDGVGVDALVVYDVDDEDDRAEVDRPFPFVPMMDPGEFVDRHLTGWSAPVVVYRAVGKYAPDDLAARLAATDPQRTLSVLVGASSRDRPVRTSLAEAYRVHRRAAPEVGLGAVLIAERHATRGDEHERMLDKQRRGAQFFVSQICYDLDHTRNLLSDYAYTCRRLGAEPLPVVVTLAPCGSTKTLDFMTWLGVDVPRWVRNDLEYGEDPLQESYEQCAAAARVLIAFCRKLRLPFGINVESVTNRKVEIEASVELAREVRSLLGR